MDCKLSWLATQPAISRMISRNGVRGRNFTKRSSFFTKGLRLAGFVPKGQPPFA
jgi:hypothetical protein